MSKLIHPIAGGIATLLIASFWISTVITELLGNAAQIAAVKTAIPWGFLLLVPSLAATAATGVIRSGGRKGGIVGRKLRRMPIIAANGVLILIPAALFRSMKARMGDLDSAFYAVQTIELLAGAANLTLLGMNMRDGLRMTHRLPRHFRRGTAV
ncbi:hypothetical protein [Ponticoccus alexandrii]|uniref:Lipoprotein n=1 Tax=Ponticoccus alexandrii TaxID=1943633 RepID=A0ABX7FAK0_9RHOB|nr:hypothetical protein [Ponticoccus alexandrii]ETA51794.1 hypothetical protein P279_12235 [Rhodobacteraceae bacterium PD-2]QRF67580.1 hypothetical protein GQA70_15435 [Ponticoccus alexandrii]